MAAVSSAVPSSVPKSTQDVIQDKSAQLTARIAPKDSSYVPYVPRSDGQTMADVPAQPKMGGGLSVGSQTGNPGKGAPSVPGMGGVLFRAQAIDPHYSDQEEASNPYSKVNNPATQGRASWIKTFANHVFNGTQNVNEAGWQQNTAQQRTSYMRIDSTRSDGYDPETAAPHQLPQAVPTQRFLPVTGTDQYGSGVLNSDTFGAGQTAGGLGGNNYTAAAGTPATNQVSPAASDMPVWG